MTIKNEKLSDDKSNRGYLFPNEKKGDKSPDYRGKLTVHGVDFYVSGWKKVKDGKDMITIALTEVGEVKA